MNKLKEIIGKDRYQKNEKVIKQLLDSTNSIGKTSVLLEPEQDGVDIIRYIQHDSYPQLEIEIIEIRITSETIGYEPTGDYVWKPIKLYNPISKTDIFKKILLIINDFIIFELTNVVISKHDKLLTFESAKLL